MNHFVKKIWNEAKKVKVMAALVLTAETRVINWQTRQVYNLFQEPVEQPSLVNEQNWPGKIWGKLNVKLNGCCLGKTSLTKNFQINFRGGGGWGGGGDQKRRTDFEISVFKTCFPLVKTTSPNFGY